MTLEEYRSLYKEEDAPAPGWDAIDALLNRVYSDVEPMHWGSILKFMVGGEDPIDGTSAYVVGEGEDLHWHFITYGMSSLYYDEEAAGGDFSRWGFEFTFRIRPEPAWGPTGEIPAWVINLLNNLARYVYKSGRWFEPYHWLDARGPLKLDSEKESEVTALVFVPDPALTTIETPHGKVQFLQLFGITSAELADIQEKRILPADLIENHRLVNPLLVTDLDRKGKLS